VTDSDTIIVRK